MNAKQIRRVTGLQHVIDKHMGLIDVTTLLGISYRQAKRLKARFARDDLAGLVHRNRYRSPVNFHLGDDSITISVLQSKIIPRKEMPHIMSKSIKYSIFCAIFALVAGQAQAFPGGATGQPTDAPPAASQPAGIKGKVVETMDAGGYTYVNVESSGQKQWAAVRQVEVKVGDSVEVMPGMVMRNFASKSLGRTFDTIIFSQGLVKQ